MSFFTTPNEDQSEVRPEMQAQPPRAGFFKSWGYAWDEQVRTAATHGIENEMQKLDRAQWKSLKDAGVDNAPAIAPAAVRIWNTLMPGPAGYDAYKHENIAKFHAGDKPISLEEQQEIRDYDARIEELRVLHPSLNLKTSADMWGEVQQKAKQAEENMGKPRTLIGQVGMLGGGMAASLNPDSDPFNFITLPVGGAGKTVAQRIGVQAGAQGIIEGINQVTGVQEQRNLLGLESGFKDGAMRTGFAALGGGAAQGLFEGVGAGVRRLFTNSKKDPAPDPSILDRSEPSSNTPVVRQQQPVEAPDRRAQPSLARLPETILAAAQEASPHGTRAGARRTEEDMATVSEQLNDWAGPSPADVKPTGRAEGDTRPDIDVARELDPVAFRRVEQAASKIDQVRADMEADTRIPKRTISAMDKLTNQIREVDAKRRGLAKGSERVDSSAKGIKLRTQLNKLLKRAEENLPQEAYAKLVRTNSLQATIDEYTPLVERAVRRAQGKWDAAEVAKTNSKPGTKEGSEASPPAQTAPKQEVDVDERISAVKEEQAVLDKAVETYRSALAKVSKGDAKIEMAGRTVDIDKDTIRVMGRDGEEEITIRQLLEDNYKTEQELEAVSTCSIL